MKIYRNKWERSYSNNVNSLYYPDENLIRFVNKYIEKRVRHKIKKKNYSFLDIGCGAGRNIAYLVENGFTVTGVDISKIAIRQAKKILNFKRIPKKNYKLINVSSSQFFLKNSCFDSIISCATLDSMPSNEIEMTIKNIKKMLKKKGLLYVDLMSTKQKRKGKFLNKYDQVVKEKHERGTIQSYWNIKRIKEKFKKFKTVQIKKITTQNKNKITNERFYCLFKNT